MQNKKRKDKFSPQELQAEEWLKKAADDELFAASILRHRDAPPSGACFHAQQAAEKLFLRIMKQNSLKIRPRRISRGLKEKVLEKPLAKGAALESAKNENSKQTKQISTYVIPVKTGIQSTIVVDSRFRGNDRGASGNDRGIKKTNFRNWNFDIVSNFVFRASKFKSWHKISAWNI